MIDIRYKEHAHLSTRSIVGVEFCNVLFENKIDASLSFMQLMNEFAESNRPDIAIEDVVRSMEGDGNGIYVGVPGLILMVSSCDGECFSPSWN